MLWSEFYFSKCIIHLSCVLFLNFWFENFLTVQKQHIIFVKKSKPRVVGKSIIGESRISIFLWSCQNPFTRSRNNAVYSGQWRFQRYQKDGFIIFKKIYTFNAMYCSLWIKNIWEMSRTPTFGSGGSASDILILLGIADSSVVNPGKYKYISACRMVKTFKSICFIRHTIG